MLGLKLRPEFQTPQMTGTQISLSDVIGSPTPNSLLTITYPTADVRQGLSAVANEAGRPLVIIGERGRGKSHLMGLMHFAFQAPNEVRLWAANWSKRVGDNSFGQLALPSGFTPISVVMNDHDYPTLWEPLFRHWRKGEYYRGKFAETGQPVPPRQLIEAALTEQPTALILDEFESWYRTQERRDHGGGPGDFAFSFIQILSEIAAARPDLLRLIVSVLSGQTDAYRQIHRINPVLIDFKTSSAREDRIRLTQHRLFENHANISEEAINESTRTYQDERIRLFFDADPGPRQEEAREEVRASWPFSPELLHTIEDEILMSSVAQETRDFMRILVRMYRLRGELVPILTSADIDVSSEEGVSAELAGVIDTMAVHGPRLREVAQRNLLAVQEQGLDLPNAGEIISSIWVHSLQPPPQSGAQPAQLHLAITRDRPIDDNVFDDELTRLRDASFNIHTMGDRLAFKVQENPRAKLIAWSRNSRLFDTGQDTDYIRKATKAALYPADAATTAVSQIVVLGPDWETKPWVGRSAEELPGAWRSPVVIVLPENVASDRLGIWLKNLVPEKRNLVRFLMPQANQGNVYKDNEIIENARCALLAEDWANPSSPLKDDWSKGDTAQYRTLALEFQKALREKLRRRFERLAVLTYWNYPDPEKTRFDFSTVSLGQQSMLNAIEDHLKTALFDSEQFRTYVAAAAAKQQNVLNVLTNLTEPPPSPDTPAIVYLGESGLYERILQLVARGEIVLQKDSAWYRRESNEVDDAAVYNRIRGKVWVLGKYLSDVTIALPNAVGPTPQAPPPNATLLGPPENSTRSISTPYPVPIATAATGMLESPAAQFQPTVKTFRSNGPRIGINLVGDLGRWNLTGAAKEVRLETATMKLPQLKDLAQRLPPGVAVNIEVRISGVGLTVQQIKDIVSRLPPNLQANLEVDADEPAS